MTDQVGKALELVDFVADDLPAPETNTYRADQDRIVRLLLEAQARALIAIAQELERQRVKS